MVDTTTHDVMVAQTEKAGQLLDYFQGHRDILEADRVAHAAAVDGFVATARDDLTYMHSWEIIVQGDSDKFYPVCLAADYEKLNHIEITRGFSQADKVPGLMALHSRFVGTNGTWGGNTIKIIPQIYSWRYQEPMAHFGPVRHGMWSAFWLRGGGYSYHVKTNNRYANPQVFLERERVYHLPNNPQYDWYVEPLAAVEATMLSNDYGFADAVNTVPNQI